MAVWPVALPKPLAASYEEQPGANKLRTDMDTGPAKVRRRSTAIIKTMAMELQMTLAEVSVFKSFYHSDLKEGVLSFTMPDPVTGSTIKARFNGAYSLRTNRGWLWRCSFNLEVLR